MINKEELKAQVQTRINALDGTEKPDELLVLTMALDSLTNNRIIPVANVANLPDLSITSNIASGTIYYIEDYNLYAIASTTNKNWYSLDRRIVKNNSNTSYNYIYSTGGATYGKLGNLTTALSRSSPDTITGNITNWKQISTGVGSSFGITETGIAYAWGLNSGDGRLGINDVFDKAAPIKIAGNITNWKQISDTRDTHSLGVTETGIAYAWGGNAYGQLGDNTTVSRSSPVTVIGGITNWSQVSAGDYHSLGLTSSGIAYGWGSNASGQLGTNNTVSRSSPVTVIGGITNWTQVRAGSHSLGLTSSGIAYGWGNNASGQLGDNTTVSKSSPVTVVGGITNWSQLIAGSDCSFGLTSSGIAYAWGSNPYGRLGTNDTSTYVSPVTVVGGITNWTQVSGGSGFNSMGLTSSGIAYAWGYNNVGQLGDGTIIERSSPVTVIGGITNWSQVSTGSGFALLLRTGVNPEMFP